MVQGNFCPTKAYYYFDSEKLSRGFFSSDATHLHPHFWALIISHYEITTINCIPNYIILKLWVISTGEHIKIVLGLYMFWKI